MMVEGLRLSSQGAPISLEANFKNSQLSQATLNDLATIFYASNYWAGVEAASVASIITFNKITSYIRVHIEIPCYIILYHLLESILLMWGGHFQSLGVQRGECPHPEWRDWRPVKLQPLSPSPPPVHSLHYVVVGLCDHRYKRLRRSLVSNWNGLRQSIGGVDHRGFRLHHGGHLWGDVDLFGEVIGRRGNVFLVLRASTLIIRRFVVISIFRILHIDTK